MSPALPILIDWLVERPHYITAAFLDGSWPVIKQLQVFISMQRPGLDWKERRPIAA